MHPPFPILLSLATLLSPALGVPSPRRGGGFGGGGGGGGGGGNNGLALAALGGVIVANSQNGYSTYGADPPDAGYDAKTSCDYNGAGATDAFATDPAWISSMTTCLQFLNGANWAGMECNPPTGDATFGFWIGEDDYSDQADCYQRCSGCIGTAINASQAVTTTCTYEYRTKRALIGYKTHTCKVGYDKHPK